MAERLGIDRQRTATVVAAKEVKNERVHLFWAPSSATALPGSVACLRHAQIRDEVSVRAGRSSTIVA